MTDFEGFAHYLVYERLGVGGMATVHRATLELEDGSTQEVALKRLLPQFAKDKRFIDDFVREAQLARHLHHPNIVRILELGRHKGTYFIAMELVRGAALLGLMQRAHRLKKQAPIGAVLAIAREVCDALHHAHVATDDAGAALPIVHRDLTPSNLLVTDDGHVKVIDFGVAKALAGMHQTSSGFVKGKLGYMSFEAISGQPLDTRADIFSAGVVLWELIAGRRLFSAQHEYEVIVQVRDGDVSPPSDHNPACPPQLDTLVLRAVARDAEDRWPSAAAMRRALDAIGGGSAADVVAWRRSLRAESAQRRHDSEAESTAIVLSADDLAETFDVDAPDELAEGSQRAAPDDSLDLPLAPRVESERPKFVDSDTVVSEQTLPERKR